MPEDLWKHTLRPAAAQERDAGRVPEQMRMDPVDAGAPAQTLHKPVHGVPGHPAAIPGQEHAVRVHRNRLRSMHEGVVLDRGQGHDLLGLRAQRLEPRQDLPLGAPLLHQRGREGSQYPAVQVDGVLAEPSSGGRMAVMAEPDVLAYHVRDIAAHVRQRGLGLRGAESDVRAEDGSIGRNGSWGKPLHPKGHEIALDRRPERQLVDVHDARHGNNSLRPRSIDRGLHGRCACRDVTCLCRESLCLPCYRSEQVTA